MLVGFLFVFNYFLLDHSKESEVALGRGVWARSGKENPCKP